MTVRSKYLLQKGSSQETNRLGVAAHWTLASDLRVRNGLAPNTDLSAGTVTAEATPSANVNVAAFQAIIQGAQALQGAYEVTNDGTVNLDVLGAGGLAPDSLARNDIICVRQQDLGYGDPATTSGLHIVRGAPSALPEDPSLNQALAGVQGSVLPLYRVRVKALAAYGGTVAIANADVDDLRRWTVPRGGIVPVVNQLDRDGLALWRGLTVYRLDQGIRQVWDGTSWRGGWQAYNPTWTADGSAPSFGNGSISGLYRLDNGEVDAQIVLTLGTTGTSGGSGAYRLSLPVPADDTKDMIGKALYAVAGGGAATHIMFPSLSTTTAFRLITGATPGALWGVTTPQTITASTVLRARVRYTAA